MPNIVIRIPSGVLDDGARGKLVAAINKVVADVEQIPDDPKKQFLCWVAIEEIAPGNWTCGGNDVSAHCIPVSMVVHLPAGVLDDAARARYADGMQAALGSALPREKRSIFSSCIFNEVADGMWGVTGALWRLEDFAAAAGYRHLAHPAERKARP